MSMTQENKTSTDKLHLTNELFYNTAVSYPFTRILTVLIILAGRKYNSAKYFLDLISSSQNVSQKEWIFLCILSICCVFCDYDLRYTVFFIRQKDQSSKFKITGRCFRKAAIVGQEPGVLSGWRNVGPGSFGTETEKKPRSVISQDTINQFTQGYRIQCWHLR